MRRIDENYLKLWFTRHDRMPLIIRGARQTGKTTLVRQFAKENEIQLIEINLEKIRLNSLNSSELNLKVLLEEIEYKHNITLGKKTLIFFDEIQESPKLVEALRYFYEDFPELAIIGAGSLFELVISKEQITFPVGRVEFYYLTPMTFSEFLLAMEQDKLEEAVRNLSVKEFMHNDLIEWLKKYFFIGGMPKAILTYKESHSLHAVREVQEKIIETYKSDFPKYGPRVNYKRLERIFLQAALQIGEKIILQNLDRESKAHSIREAIELLIDAMIILPTYHSECSGLPLNAGTDYSISKLFFLDVGLMNAISRLDYDSIGQNFLTKGKVAEQFVAQHLQSFNGKHIAPELRYWLRDKAKRNAEVDFVIQKQNKIMPIEVKAEEGGKMKSLLYFCQEKKCQQAILLNSLFESHKTIKAKINENDVEIQIHSLPLYLTESLAKANTLKN